MKLLFLMVIIIAATNAYGQSWLLAGNSTSGGDFLGTTNRQALLIKVNNTQSGLIDYDGTMANTMLGYLTFSLNNGAYNTAVGYEALNLINGATSNDAFGYRSLAKVSTGNANSGYGTYSLYNNTTGFNNVALGGYGLAGNTTGSRNTAGGYFSLYNNTTGSNNTAYGLNALYSNTTVDNLCAFGNYALFSNTTGIANVATGYKALYSNTSGYGNTATGYEAHYSNTTGFGNTANGDSALRANTTGYYNIAVGSQALISNTTGYYNSTTGAGSMYFNTTGYYNSAFGGGVLGSNSTGYENSAAGFSAMGANTTGYYNSAFGTVALNLNTTGYGNSAFGYAALTGNSTGTFNTGLGFGADMTFGNVFSNATAVGALAIVNASNKVRIGDVNVTVIEGQPASYTSSSDGRFKTHINEEDIKGLEFIKLLRPVAYNFDTKKFEEFLTRNMADSIRNKYLNRDFTASTNIRHSGFIAQEVEKVAKEVGYDFDAIHKPESENDNYSLAYSQFVVPLVKAVQELSKDNDKLNEEKDQLRAQLNELSKRMAAIELSQQQGAKASSQSVEINDVASLEQNAPNPFNNNTIIRYNVPLNTKNAQIVVTDMNGVTVKNISLSNKGFGNVVITARTLMSGNYIYALIIDGKKIDSKQMILTK